jgi:hypothetical protein
MSSVTEEIKIEHDKQSPENTAPSIILCLLYFLNCSIFPPKFLYKIE